MHGIYVGYSNFITIDGNDLNDNIYHGMVIVGYSGNITVSRNLCNGNGLFGIQMERADYNLVTDNVCNGNALHGIYVEISSGTPPYPTTPARSMVKWASMCGNRWTS